MATARVLTEAKRATIGVHVLQAISILTSDGFSVLCHACGLP
jgi:hypothetical protein